MARHVGPQLVRFEPLSKDSIRDPLTNCTILGLAKHEWAKCSESPSVPKMA
jgi:hypothetical protein